VLEELSEENAYRCVTKAVGMEDAVIRLEVDQARGREAHQKKQKRKLVS
jgi:hypothetical protein